MEIRGGGGGRAVGGGCHTGEDAMKLPTHTTGSAGPPEASLAVDTDCGEGPRHHNSDCSANRSCRHRCLEVQNTHWMC